MELEQKELNNCTFKPEIHDAPEYIKQIAKSFSLAKNTKEKTPPKPSWKYQEYSGNDSFVSSKSFSLLR